MKMNWEFRNLRGKLYRGSIKYFIGLLYRIGLGRE
jgi:hypothetical protein